MIKSIVSVRSVLATLGSQFIMGCCGCGGRVTSIFAAIFSLIQACGWIGLAIYGLQLYSCDVTPNLAGSQLGEAAVLFFYIVYFFNTECIGSGVIVTLPDKTPLPLTPPYTAEPTERTHMWMVIYISLSALWIVTSVLLLVGAVGNKRGRCGAVMYYPWVLVTGAIIVCDVIAAAIYFMDVPDTMGLPDLLQFINVPPPPAWQPDPNPTDLLTTIPSIVMGLIFSRFVIIWIINTALFVYVILAAVAASKAVSQPTNWKRLSKQEMARTSDQKPWLTQRPEELPRNHPYASTMEPRHTLPYPQEASPNPYQAYQPFSYAEPPPVSPTYEGFQPRAPPQDEESQKSALQQASEHRYALKAAQPMKRFGNPQPPNSINRSESFERRAAPHELRSQLPWSYFQSRDEMPMRLQNTREEEELPPIPVPDYTLHFPKRQRADNILQGRESPVHGAPLRLTQPERSSFTAPGRYNDRY